MKKVLVRQEKVTIPTYPISAYDKNPMFPIPKLIGNMMPSIWKTIICL